MKQYKIWIHVEEHDTETDEYTNKVAEPESLGEGMFFNTLDEAKDAQMATKYAGELALTMPQLINNYTTVIDDAIAGEPINIVSQVSKPELKEDDNA